MHNEFTAIIEQDDDWYIAYCPEVPGANGQGRTIQECRKNLADAINLIFEDRRQGAFEWKFYHFYEDIYLFTQSDCENDNLIKM